MTAKTCQAFDVGYPRECTNTPRFHATKHESVEFDLCGQHLHRVWRANYQVVEIAEDTTREAPTSDDTSATTERT
jgi:hypothetical protein